MKQIMILAMMAICGALSGQTTMEEYNYVTKGYKIQIESGLDMKKGYRLEDVSEHSVTFTEKDKIFKRVTTFKGLYREGEKSPCAIMIIYHNQDPSVNSKVYMCIPHFNSSSEIWDLHYKLATNFQEDALKAMVWGLSKATAFFARNN